jgi:hypothetical protein
VWRAITGAQQIWQGWDDYWHIPELKVGGAIKFGAQADPMLATIAVLDTPREFAIQWPPQAQFHSIEMLTRCVLEEENGATRVTGR